jgi:hypothetical protein
MRDERARFKKLLKNKAGGWTAGFATYDDV